MEIYNMILSSIIRVHGSDIGQGIGRVSINPIPIPVPEFFPFLSPYPAHTHRASGILDPNVSGFGYTRRACAFLPSLPSVGRGGSLAG
ncbi:hypothetical protein Hanom_Chr14g01267861 [Helianthus anomalus]